MNTEDEDDFQIEDILKRKKKKINGSTKGKRSERSIVNIFNDRFSSHFAQHPDIGKFSRSVGSGNRFGQKVTLSKNQTEVYTGDIICETFKYVIENKSGYDIDLFGIFKKGHKEIDGFLSQVSKDCERVNKKPLLIYKKDHKDRICFVKAKDLNLKDFEYYIIYRDWVCLSLEKLLEMPDDFFF